MAERIIKYPRTPHLVGSRLQSGDEDLSQIPFSALKGKHIVVEEKVDGANTAVSFSQSGELLLQSRGHYLTGGSRERHYDLFKIWAATRRAELFDALGTRFVMYGEWLYAKHKVYYDALPHYFMEFDILDRETGAFLSTARRREILKSTSVVSVPVLGEGEFRSQKELLALLGPSKFVTDNRLTALRQTIERLGLDEQEILSQTDLQPLMEGLYLKVEQNGEVIDRMKFVRHGYTQIKSVEDGKWLAAAIVPNALAKSNTWEV